MADSKAHQACLEQREKKCQEGTLRQALATNRSTSNSTVRLPTKKKRPIVQLVQSARTLPHQLHPSPSSSFSTASTEPETGVELVVSHIVYEEKEEEDIATNLRVGFKERQRKRLSESITVNLAPFKKPCPEPICMDPVSALT